MSRILMGSLINQEFGERDPFFNRVSLLLRGNSSITSDNNNVFVDSSENDLSITRVGSVTQGSFSPFREQWSGYFDGASRITTPNTSRFDLSSSSLPFTIEAWVYNSGPGTFRGIFAARTNAAAEGWGLYIGDTTNRFVLYSNVTGVWTGIELNTIPIQPNTWTHLALVKTPEKYRAYVNGVGQDLNFTGGLQWVSAQPVTVGAVGSGGELPFLGYIRDARIVVGTAVYTEDFTPPTQPLTEVTGTQLLTCNSSRFKDTSENNSPISVVGLPTVSTYTPFLQNNRYSVEQNGASGYFDGSASRLVIPHSSDFEPGSSDLTWEMWINTQSSTRYAGLYTRGSGTWGSGMWDLMINNASATSGDVTLWFGNFSNTVPLMQTSGVNVRDNAWHHIAVVRNGSNWRIYVDGITRASITWSGAIANLIVSNWIGANEREPTTRNYTGYISNLRITNGQALYTEDFTPPELTFDSNENTNLLLKFENGAIVDSSATSAFQTVGDTTLDGAVYFDGTGDYIISPHRPEHMFFTAPFTIEAFIRREDSGNRAIIGKGTATTGWLLWINSNNKLVFTHGTTNIVSSLDIDINRGYNVAVVREGTGTNQTKIYINGIQDGAGTVNVNFNQTNLLYIGANRTAGDNFNGFINSVRVTNGVARYTTNFEVKQFPDF